MKRPVVLVVLVLACARTAPAPPSAHDGRTRVQLSVTSCLPVGYGMSCASVADGAPATLEACVGTGDTLGLELRLEKAPLVGTPAAPVSMWMDVVPAPPTERYCGVLVLASGAHVRVVDFER